MLAIIHLQDQGYWYPYSISIHAETKHYTQTRVVSLKPVNESSGKHFHSAPTPAYQTHTDGDRRFADTILFILCMRILGVYLGMSMFGAESIDLLHRHGRYFSMGNIVDEYGTL